MYENYKQRSKRPKKIYELNCHTKKDLMHVFMTAFGWCEILQHLKVIDMIVDL